MIGPLLLAIPILILQQKAANPDPFIGLDQPRHGLDVAIAIIRISQKRQIRGCREIPQPLDHIGEADETDIRIGVAGSSSAIRQP